MNKTVSMNLAGMIFNIDEAAYQALNAYIEQIRRIFATYDDGNEIVKDIEARIAEKLKLQLQAQEKQVVELADFEQIQREIGTAHDFEQDDNDSDATTATAKNTVNNNGRTRPQHRFYRDKQNRKVAGVAAGVAMYFGIDAALVRIVWAASIFAGGVGVVLYLVVWASTTYANTLIQRTEMQGAMPNLTNIYATRQQQNDDFGRGSSPIADVLDRIIGLGVWVVKMAVGALALLKGSLLMLVGVVLVGGASALGYLHLGRLGGVPLRNFTGSTASDFGAKSLVAILIVVPALLLIYVGLRLLFSYHLFYKNTLRILIFGWIGTVIIAILFVITTMTYFVEQAKYQTTQNIALTDSTKKMIEIQYNDYENGNQYKNFEINLRTHANDNIIIKKTYQAQGADQADAQKNAQMVGYKTEMTGNVLTLDNKLVFGENGVFRFQEADINVYVPQNTLLKLSSDTRHRLGNETIGSWLFVNDGYDIAYDFENKNYMLINDTIKCQNCGDLLQEKYWKNAEDTDEENQKRRQKISSFLIQ